ncbi:uncharacterized protein METZ01_LOCUS195182, partial [marine metagenome]
MEAWHSIDESLSDPSSAGPLVLKGIPVIVPHSYGRLSGRKRVGSLLFSVASFLWRVTAWSFSILAHLICLILLVKLLVQDPEPNDMIVEVSLAHGSAGEEGKTLEPLPPKEPEPEPEPEPE